MENSGYPVILDEFLNRQGMLYPDLMARIIIQSGGDTETLAKEYISRIKDLNSWYLRGLNQEETAEFLLPGDTAGSRVWPSDVIKEVWKEFPSQEGGA